MTGSPSPPPRGSPPPTSRSRGAVLPLALVAAAPLAWFTHLSISYWLVPPGCRAGSSTPIRVATATAIAIVAAVGVLAWRSLQRSRPGGLHQLLLRSPAAPGSRQVSAVAVVAVTMAAYFGFVIAMTGLSAVIVDPCA